MASFRRVCVFCASNPGANPSFGDTAASLGRMLAEQGIELVFGGGKVGLMGVVADATMAAGGRATGVMPRSLVEREIAHLGLTELRIVESMHERKALMAELADAFLALPGGWGTLEEFCEVVTWAQLGIHQKPCGLLNVDGYYDHLLSFLDHAVGQGLLKPQHRSLVVCEADPSALLARMEGHEMPGVKKWISEAET